MTGLNRWAIVASLPSWSVRHVSRRGQGGRRCPGQMRVVSTYTATGRTFRRVFPPSTFLNDCSPCAVPSGTFPLCSGEALPSHASWDGPILRDISSLIRDSGQRHDKFCCVINRLRAAREGPEVLAGSCCARAVQLWAVHLVWRWFRCPSPHRKLYPTNPATTLT